jgi:hypothetical protein
MEPDNYLIGIAILFRVLSIGKFIRLIFFRIAYPNATLRQIENFEKNTTPTLSKWIKNDKND